MKINLIARIKNRSFWLSFIPAVLLLVQVIAAVFGYTLDLGDLGNKLLNVVNALFAVLCLLGIVVDPIVKKPFLIPSLKKGLKIPIYFC